MLTLAQVKSAAPRERAYKMGDAGGLYLFVAPTGLRSWRVKYRFGGKERLLVLGTFPNMSLADARALRDDARQDLRLGIDPAAEKRQAAADAAADALTFEVMARAWHAHQRPRWTDVHAAEILVSLERDVFPALGSVALSGIDAPAVLEVLRAVERRGCLETARRLRQRISAVFTLAMSEGKTSSDPAAIVRKALAPSLGARRQSALLDLHDVQGLLRECDVLDAAPVVKLASRFLALTAARLACVRLAEWREIEGLDWTGQLIGPALPLWRIPAAKMKLTAARKADAANAHVIPLSREAVEALRVARALALSDRFVFATAPAAAISESAIGRLYSKSRYAGRHVPHGWRAAFSTIMNEEAPAERAVIDQALGHVAKDKVEAAYNRATQMVRRRHVLQRWATMLASDLAPARQLVPPNLR